MSENYLKSANKESTGQSKDFKIIQMEVQNRLSSKEKKSKNLLRKNSFQRVEKLLPERLYKNLQQCTNSPMAFNRQQKSPYTIIEEYNFITPQTCQHKKVIYDYIE